MKKQDYVLGFILNQNKSKILLIRKNRPQYQKGFLNGIGGKIELNETPKEAIVRETHEEVLYNGVKYLTLESEWTEMGSFSFETGSVYCFSLLTDLDFSLFKEGEDEILEVHNISEINYKECLPPFEDVLTHLLK